METVGITPATGLPTEGDVNLQAAQNNASLSGSSSSSSASVGVSFGAQSGVTVAASRGRGSEAGNDTWYDNTHVSAGSSVVIQSGADTTLQGASVSANQVQANVGGNLTIESLQDTSTYESRNSNAGGSITFGPGGIPTGGSLGAGHSRIDSDYASVNERSGIEAGDGGFQVSVGNNTTLAGGVIASTQQAVDQSSNSFTTGGTLTASDIQNQASYEGDAVGVSGGVGLQSNGNYGVNGFGAGIGSDSGTASSVTTAGISGIAGNTSVRTGDAQGGIDPIFDKDKVQREIDAQVAITMEFGRQASRAIGDYAKTQMEQANGLRVKANDPSLTDEQRNELLTQAQSIEDKWGDNGSLRLLSHTVVGGLTGGASGAAGAAAGTLSAPAIASALEEAGVDGSLASTITGIGSTLIGAATGGTAGGAAALNEVANNYLKHEEINKLIKAKAGCEAGKADDCRTVDALNALDKQRQQDIQNACASFTSDACRTKLTEAGQDFDGLVLYQQYIWDNIREGKTTYEEMKPYLNKAALEIKDIAGPLKDYYYSMSGGDRGTPEKPNPYWVAYKQIDGLNANDLANLWNATAAINSTRKTLLPDAPASANASGPTVKKPTPDAMLPEADFSNRPSGINETTPVKDTFGKPPNDSDLAAHLSTGGPSAKSVYGAHAEAAYQTELKSINGTEVGSPVEIAPGIWQHSYTTPERTAKGQAPYTKTTYDRTWTDQQILDMSKQASSQVWTSYQSNGVMPPTTGSQVDVAGIPFTVYFSKDKFGALSVYSHPGIPKP